MAGDYSHELGAARQARHQYPDAASTLLLEAIPLATTRRHIELQAVIDTSLAYPSTIRPSTAFILRVAGIEALAHGDWAAGRSLFERGLSWLGNRPIAGASTEEAMREHALLLYLTNRFPEARSLFVRLYRDHPDQNEYLAYLGLIAVKLKDERAAMRVDERLARVPHRDYYSYNQVPPAYWRADIAALQDQQEQAIDLLQQALDQGADFELLHEDVNLSALRTNTRFVRLSRPQD
jgi:tetratricopeptide (TPR) repeat protein